MTIEKPAARALIREDKDIRKIERRLFLKQSLSLGALTLLTGCDVTDIGAVQSVTAAMSKWNDGVQAALFSQSRLAPEYTEADITTPFPFNAYYKRDRVPYVDGATYKLELSGLIQDTRPWTLEQLRALPQKTQITRHVCVEGWSAIGKWGGIPFASFLQRIGADARAAYVGFKCADNYYSSIDMATALHPQTIIALTYADQTLPPEFGFPMKLRIPTKLGFKNPKHIMAMFVTNTYPGGYWEDKGYNWYSGS